KAAPMGVARLNALSDAVFAMKPSVFADVITCASRRGGPFRVLPGPYGMDPISTEWLNWPLRRLFEERRACLITGQDGRRALAVPSSTAGDARYVALFILPDEPLGKENETF